MGAKERIKQFCKASGIKITDFEKRIGASNGYVNSISRWVGPEYEKAILENFPNLNIVWAEKGIGSMFVNEPSRPGKKKIPLYNDSVSIGGMNGVVANVDGQDQVTEWIDAGDWFPGATAAIQHYGDSMVEYPSGCILALKRVNDPRLLINGATYVIETDEFRITKQIQDDGGDYIMAYSSNRETYPDGRLIHSPIRIPKETIRHLDLVLGYVVKRFSNIPVQIAR